MTVRLVQFSKLALPGCQHTLACTNAKMQYRAETTYFSLPSKGGKQRGKSQLQQSIGTLRNLHI